MSGDKFVARQARGLGAGHVTCRALLGRMAGAERDAADPLKGEDPRKFRGVPQSEMKSWMEYCGLTEEEP